MKTRSSLLALSVAIAAFSAPAQSQTNTQSNDIVKISEWNYDGLYENGGIQSDNLMDAEVFGTEGEEIGSVENVIISDQNQIIAIIAQVGGLWDIGDTHVAVPWDEVELTDDGIQIPVNEDNVDDYDLYGENTFVTKADLQQVVKVDDDLSAGSRTWKLSDLVDDYATLSGEVGYGYVDNVIFSEAGEIQAVVVESAGAYGRGAYAYPFYGYSHGWNPGYSAYELPYEENEVGDLDTFDYDEFDNTWE